MSDRHLVAAELRAAARALRRKTRDKPVSLDGDASAQLVHLIGIGVRRVSLDRRKEQVGNEAQAAGAPLQSPQPVSAGLGAGFEPEVMNADQVAAFLGVDRNTVYDYAGRGVIPHRRLGKRILFHRGALVSWLDTSCKAASTRKG